MTFFTLILSLLLISPGLAYHETGEDPTAWQSFEQLQVNPAGLTQAEQQWLILLCDSYLWPWYQSVVTEYTDTGVVVSQKADPGLMRACIQDVRPSRREPLLQFPPTPPSQQESS